MNNNKGGVNPPLFKTTTIMAGTPFKLKSGNSPLKQTKDWFNVRGYLKGEQGLIPDWKGEKTTTTATKVSKSIQNIPKKIESKITEYKGRRLHQKEKRISEGKKSLFDI